MQMNQQGKAPVVTCAVAECAYNQQQKCMAPNIEVGDR